MKKKSIVMMCTHAKARGTMLAIGVLMIIGGCGKKEDNDIANTPVPTSVGLEKQAEDYINYIDIQAIADTLMINKKSVAFPVAESEFGEGLFIGEAEMIDYDARNYYRASLTDGEYNKALLNFYSKDGKSEDAKIYFIETSVSGGLDIQLAGITFGASLEQVIASVGEPLYQNGSLDEIYRIYYENSVNEYLAFAFENGVVSTIIFNYLPPELRE